MVSDTTAYHSSTSIVYDSLDMVVAFIVSLCMWHGTTFDLVTGLYGACQKEIICISSSVVESCQDPLSLSKPAARTSKHYIDTDAYT
jgi:hypothetical protein